MSLNPLSNEISKCVAICFSNPHLQEVHSRARFGELAQSLSNRSVKGYLGVQYVDDIMIAEEDTVDQVYELKWAAI